MNEWVFARGFSIFTKKSTANRMVERKVVPELGVPKKAELVASVEAKLAGK